MTVALLDIDRFRHLNLEHGYAAGDAVLVAVGGIIAERTRVHDLACRMAGDEFGFLLPETAAAASLEPINRILVELEDLRRAGYGGISASVGIADLGAGKKPEAVLAAAQAALEQARADGLRGSSGAPRTERIPAGAATSAFAVLGGGKRRDFPLAGQAIDATARSEQRCRGL